MPFDAENDLSLTKEDYLERLEWSLRVDFEDLLEGNPDNAMKFADWCINKIMLVGRARTNPEIEYARQAAIKLGLIPDEEE